MSTLRNTILAGAVLAVGASVPIVPVTPQDHYITSVEDALEARAHHREREEYYRANNFDQKHIDQAVKSRDEIEQKMVEREMIRTKGEADHRVRPPKKERQSLIRTVAQHDFVSRALAFDWGKEDLESCTTATLPCNFDSNDSWGSVTVTIDTGSEVNGSNSLECAFTAEAACFLTEKTDVSTSTTYYYQFSGKLATGFTFGASGYSNVMEISDTAGNQIMYLNIEDYGTVRLILDGPAISYTNTSLDLPIGSVYKLEVKVTVNATTGEVDIWLDNNTEGSPDYDGSANINTGSTDVGEVGFGNIYSPNGSNTMFFDDAIGDTSFIGAGTTTTSRRIITYNY